VSTYPVPAIGQRLTAEFVQSMLPQFAWKTSDDSTISDTTLSADPDLTLTVESDARYEMEAVIRYTSPVAADFKFAFTVPAGATGSFVYQGIQTGSAAGAYADDQHGVGTTITATPAVGGGAAINEAVSIHGQFTTAGTSGSLTFTWAQNTSTASNTTVQADSFIKLTRME
jgi:hypothetical protein